MTIHCPACDTAHPDATFTCRKCGVATHIAERYVLQDEAPSTSGEDVVDRASTLRQGTDVETGDSVVIRIATIGNEARLEREATILKGLRSASVPRVLFMGAVDGLGVALVLTAPPFPTLQAQVEDGLRLDDARARQLVDALLGGLRELHRLSPPVHHRNLHPDTVAWDGASKVFFLDFARATDTVDDAERDLVAARPGYAPTRSATAAQHDLFGLSATVAHVLSRREIGELPQTKSGAPDIRPNIVVSDHVERFLAALLDPTAPGAPRDIDDAIALWAPPSKPLSPELQANERQVPRTFFMIAALVCLFTFSGFAVVGFFFMSPRLPPDSARPIAVEPISLPAIPREVPPAPSAVAATPARKAEEPTKPAPVPARRVRREKPKKARPTPAGLFRRELLNRKEALMVCDDPANTRIRMKVSLSLEGRVTKLSEVGRSRGTSAQCVRSVLEGVSLTTEAVLKPVTLDVWVWTHPKFKVNVF